MYVVTALAVVTPLVWYYVSSPVIPIEKLEKIAGGMTAEELADLVGEPSYYGEWEHWHTDKLTYSHPFKLGVVEIGLLGTNVESVRVDCLLCPDELRQRAWDYDHVSEKWVLRTR